MKIERVEGNRKVRVLLTENDLTEMNINIRTLTSDSPELTGFLYKVMDYINKETGFNAKSGQIVIEASPADGGVVLTVTKIIPERKTVKIDPCTVKAKKKENSKKLFRFTDFGALTSYLILADRNKLLDMKLYSYKDSFFIVSTVSDSYIHEFSDRITALGTNDIFLSEHARHIASGEKLVSMADGIKKLK
ncbi:MAG: adaptor protein MecA [Clostridia bacterium]|nr:adaptor protein MecA [Clostridia bacterium]